jgi:hypothetical protein
LIFEVFDRLSGKRKVTPLAVTGCDQQAMVGKIEKQFEGLIARRDRRGRQSSGGDA